MFNLNSNLNLKFISISVSYGSQFKFYFILVFNFKLTSKAVFFIILNIWFEACGPSVPTPTSCTTSFFEGSQPFKFFYTQLCVQQMDHWNQLQLFQSLLLSFIENFYEMKGSLITYGEVQVLHPFASMLE